MLIGFGISPSRVKKSGGGVSYDTDAEAFFTAASITDVTQKNAVNQLVLDLKSYNIWSKMKALYPIVGGSASSHAVNLKTPGTYNLTFSTGWTHASTGMTPNGNSAYANTSLNSQTIVNSTNHLSFYSRTSTVDLSNSCEIGAADTNGALYNQLRLNVSYISGGTSAIVNFSNTTDGRGFWIGTKRGSSDRETYLNGSTQSTNTTNDTSNNPNYNLFLSARNQPTNIGSPIALYSSKQCAFASIGDGLTDTEAANFYTAVQAFQTTLSRNV